MRLLHTLLLLFTFLQLGSQHAPQPHFRNYSTEHGLPSPEVYCAFQDSQGYLWFGTDNGAARFDGYGFRTYDAQDGLTSNVVFDIYEDAKGRIWFGTMTGEAFILEGDTIVPYRYNHLVKKYQNLFQVAGLVYLEPKEETAYFELVYLGFLRVDSTGKDSLITSQRPCSRLILEVEGCPGLLRTIVTRNEEEEGVRYWTQYDVKRKVSSFEFRSGTDIFKGELPLYGAGGKIKFQAQKISTGQILIFFFNHVYCWLDGQLQWAAPFDGSVNEMYEDNNQGYWICGADGMGLRHYENLTALKNGEYGSLLDGHSVAGWYADHNGGRWACTLEKGIYYCPNPELLIYDSRFGLSDDFVSSVAFKNEREVFAGCENGDIFQLDIGQNRIIARTKNPFGHHNFDLLYQPEKDALWSTAAFWDGNRWNSVFVYDFIWNKSFPWESQRFDKLHLNAQGELLGCHSNGFAIVDTRNALLKFSSTQLNSRERAFAIHTALDNRIWVGNARGLFEFQDSALVSPGIGHPAFHHRVEDIDEFPDGSLVFGTKGWGVVRWKGEDILQITTDDGLSANMIEDVHVDENGILWVGTLNGLNKVAFDAVGRPAVRRFTVSNGLPSNEVSKVKSYAGQVWLCTAGGLVQFHEPEEDTLAVVPVIQHLRANGAEVPLASAQELKHDSNSLEFRFLVINYRQNGHIPYRYRLNEKADWQYTENLTVNYPQLPPGGYRFEVQAQNQDGYWSPSATYAFTILPPWWQTWWARTLVGGLALGGIFYYQRLRIARLKKEAAFQQQVAELERSALQAQMNPHFIFNCLNSIQNFILNNDKKKAVEFLARFARLVRHNLSASVQGRVTLAEEVQILENYLALERERFNQKIDYRITVEEGLEEEDITFPPLLIQPYVENAVVHGLAKKEGGGMVSVHFQRDNGALAVTVRDNGLGFRQDDGEEPSTRHRSVGMTITQKRLELLSGAEGKAVQVEVLKGEDGEVLGTEVRVRVGK